MPPPFHDPRPGVLQLVDSLAIGGTERVAVNLANLLPRDQFRSFLCATRHSGPLAAEIRPDIGMLDLRRRGRFGIAAILRLTRHCQENHLVILHAHSSSVFLATICQSLLPRLNVVWHDHCGFADTHQPLWLYRLLGRRLQAAIGVKQALVEFARGPMGMPPARTFYIPNFVPLPPKDLSLMNGLPGVPGKRVVCMANFRPQKDHPTLLTAWRQVQTAHPDAHLLLPGALGSADYMAAIHGQIAAQRLSGSVTILGPRTDVPAVLQACSIGVLSSQNEGLPMALLEYGANGLAAVATEAGQCGDVLDHGQAGLLVPSQAPKPLADAIGWLLQEPGYREELGRRLQDRVRQHYSPQAVLDRVQEIYRRILTRH